MRLLKISILSLLYYACSSQRYARELSVSQREILNSVVSEAVYHKTLISEFDKPISNYVETNFLEFDLCSSEEFRAKKIQLSEDEIKFLKSRFDSQKIINLNRLNPKLSNRAAQKRERFKTVSISLPVIFRGDSLGLYYVSGTYGGEFGLLQKKNNSWEKVCSSLVWIE